MDMDYHNASSLGCQLIVALVKQLDGMIEIDSSDGTMFRLSFPADTPEKALAHG